MVGRHQSWLCMVVILALFCRSNCFAPHTFLKSTGKFLPSTRMLSTVPEAQQMQRDRFAQFILARNWKFCESYWSRIVKHASDNLPSFVVGEDVAERSPPGYGVSDLAAIRDAGKKGEFVSKNPRYHLRQTLALRVGYDGNQYHGYQKQSKKNQCPGLTVEGDICLALGHNTSGAGRTDRGVSAVSQVICFATQDMTVTPDQLMQKFKDSAPCKEGRLSVYDCQRVPKKFNARASATWRRYLYLFPLNRVTADNNHSTQGEALPEGVYASPNSAAYDVDVDALNRILGR
jgi:hypothetical protein